MPRGSYRLPGGVVEAFACSVDPDGAWHYSSTRPGGWRLALSVDPTGVLVTLHVETGRWQLRGGACGPEVGWERGGEPGRAAAAGFTGTSPAYDVAVARRLSPVADRHTRVALVEVSEPVAATRTVQQRWRRTGVLDAGGLAVSRWEVADLDTGVLRVVHLVGDVVVDAPGVRLADLDTPPSGFTPLTRQP